MSVLLRQIVLHIHVEIVCDTFITSALSNKNWRMFVMPRGALVLQVIAFQVYAVNGLLWCITK